jgi:hypothetical protein
MARKSSSIPSIGKWPYGRFLTQLTREPQPHTEFYAKEMLSPGLRPPRKQDRGTMPTNIRLMEDQMSVDAQMRDGGYVWQSLQDPHSGIAFVPANIIAKDESLKTSIPAHGTLDLPSLPDIKIPELKKPDPEKLKIPTATESMDFLESLDIAGYLGLSKAWRIITYLFWIAIIVGILYLFYKMSGKKSE